MMTMHCCTKSIVSLALCSLLAVINPPVHGATPVAAASASQEIGAQLAASDPLPTLLTPAQTAGLFPATVYYRGQSAPVQLRNAAGARFGPEGYLLVALVDTSGYASNLQETYQMYLITEDTLSIGGHRLSPGAYGAGVVNGMFIVTDVGGHPILHANTMLDQALTRPRPLQLLASPTGGLRLYLGRTWISVAEVPVH